MASEQVNERRESFILKKPKVLARGVYTTQEKQEEQKTTFQFGNEKNQDETKQLLSHHSMKEKDDEELELLPRLEKHFSHDSNNAKENVSHTTNKKTLIKTIITCSISNIIAKITIDFCTNDFHHFILISNFTSICRTSRCMGSAPQIYLILYHRRR